MVVLIDYEKNICAVDSQSIWGFIIVYNMIPSNERKEDKDKNSGAV
jgi:hypothetical protein